MGGFGGFKKFSEFIGSLINPLVCMEFLIMVLADAAILSTVLHS
jgi:hypothetical protein